MAKHPWHHVAPGHPQLSMAPSTRTMQNIEQKGGVHMDQHRRVLITEDAMGSSGNVDDMT